MSDRSPYLGVIEGFFGRSWTFKQRHDYAEFLHRSGYQFYIYAPKNDPYLRKSWQQDWPSATSQQLSALVKHYQSLNLDFGLGLSPFEIYTNYDTEAQQTLEKKIERLNALNIDVLCLLFDDMRGDLPDLAKTQIKITQDVVAKTTAKKVIMCPTYYSFDPVLERVFGTMPDNYLQELGAGLPPEVDVFWTGPKVCSDEYPEEHLQQVIKVLRRKPFLWDNYPVNDGAKLSQYLHLKAFENRFSGLANLTKGHAVNPMNQPWLSRIPLYSLPQSYAQGKNYDPRKVLKRSLNLLCDTTLAEQIAQDIDTFQYKGLGELNENEIKQLIHQYQPFDNPTTDEIIAWLNGEYTFDPECLTD
ncbi:MAG: beta-N-acetylglucosaminidase domain-containing protein [Cocleimonas sp.]|nr:beta-N-acetylglucosaminidase domain-containing protein [Cocleimonas sp.]